MSNNTRTTKHKQYTFSAEINEWDNLEVYILRGRFGASLAVAEYEHILTDWLTKEEHWINERVIVACRKWLDAEAIDY